MSAFTAPLALVAGVTTALIGGAVLVAWAAGIGAEARLADGWRLMVPPTAVGFLLGGAALSVAAAGHYTGRDLLVVRLLASGMMVQPISTLFEYVSGQRLGVERWLGLPLDAPVGDLYAGRMSAMTSSTFVLVGLALLAMTWRTKWAERGVQLFGGAALTTSWLAALAISFDPSRLADAPRFPGMAAITIGLFALLSTGILKGSRHTMQPLRDVHAHVVIPWWLLVAAFVGPLGLGRVRALMDQSIDPGLSAAIVMVIFAVALTGVVWRAAAKLQTLQAAERQSYAHLESVVTDRTAALAIANAQLQHQQEELREIDRRKDEFIATLAHELRNPLAPLRTCIQLLKGEPTLAARTTALSVMERQTHHLVRLIDDLLDVSRITSDKLILQREATDVVDIVRQAVEATRAGSPSTHQLDLRLPQEAVVVLGDPTRLSQVVVNLLQNAVKYTPIDGRITVTVSRSRDHAEITVHDTGVGIAAAFLPRLFEKFAQATPARDRAEGGLGLGLALVRGIVSLHGGSVEVRSDGLGQGSEFLVRLPLLERDIASPALPRRPAPSAAATPAKRVLVVDDNVDNTEALAALLRQQGHLVETAVDGEDALATAERFRPDVVLLDIRMPKVDGFAVCRELRQRPWARRVRVIAQTGWGQASDRTKTREAGFDGHLVKPIDPSQLDAWLSDDRYRAASEPP